MGLPGSPPGLAAALLFGGAYWPIVRPPNLGSMLGARPVILSPSPGRAEAKSPPPALAVVAAAGFGYSLAFGCSIACGSGFRTVSRLAEFC